MQNHSYLAISYSMYSKEFSTCRTCLEFWNFKLIAKFEPKNYDNLALPRTAINMM